MACTADGDNRAGAVVTKDVPPYAIYAGVPATLIRYRLSRKLKAFKLAGGITS